MNTACFAWRLQNSGTSDPGLLSVWAAVCMAGAVFWDTSTTGVRLRARGLVCQAQYFLTC